jgi:transposase-like protein
MRDTRVLSVGNMHSQSPLCPNCSRPMTVARTIPGVLDEPEVNVFKCSRCGVNFITEDHLTISGTAVP